MARAGPIFTAILRILEGQARPAAQTFHSKAIRPFTYSILQCGAEITSGIQSYNGAKISLILPPVRLAIQARISFAIGGP